MQKINNKTKGILFLIASAFSFSLMALFVNLAGDLPVYEKAFFRNLVAIFFSVGIILKRKIPLKIQKKNMKELLLRATFGTIGLVGNFYAISHMNSIADALILNKLSPFFAVIASIFILKENANIHQWLALILAFIGSVFVGKPDFVFNTTSSNSNTFPALIGLLGGICAGIAYTHLRKLKLNGENSNIIVAFFSIFSCVTILPLVYFTYEPLSITQLFFLICAGMSACMGQFTITAAYGYCPAKEISIYDYSAVIFAAIWGFVFLGQKPDLLSIIGYIIIVGASAYIFVHNKKSDNTIVGEKYEK